MVDERLTRGLASRRKLLAELAALGLGIGLTSRNHTGQDRPKGDPGMMLRDLRAAERRRQRTRSLQALLALSIWALGGYLLYEAWHLRDRLPAPYGDVFGTAIYLITFFYVFAFWPILGTAEKLLRWSAAHEDEITLEARVPREPPAERP